MTGGAPSTFALSEVLGGLSYALDITEGEPPGHAVRTLAIGMRLAEQLHLGDEVRSALFYALLLKDAGCTATPPGCRRCSEPTTRSRRLP